jgi:cysteine desulfurase
VIYLDNHATTPVDPRVVEVMLPLLTEYFANAGSITHESGRQVAQWVAEAIESIGNHIGARGEDIVITSGATESNNLALFGYALHPRQTRRRIVSCVTEHRAILDPLKRLEQQGFEVVLLPVQGAECAAVGSIDLDQLSEAVDDRTCLVSIMLANNEIGTLQPLREIAAICRRQGAMLHSDATQAVGRMPVNVDDLDVDMLSFSAHKFYGPKGIGGLYVRRSPRRVRIQAQILGGGQQDNRRSGTLNSAAIIAMAKALTLCEQLAAEERPRIAELRDRLYRRLADGVDGLGLNGPPLDQPQLRLGSNLNCSFMPVEGQSLMLAVPELAASSGSACTSAEPRPSHVLRAIGLSDEEARSSLRCGIGRFTTTEEIDRAATALIAANQQLRTLL